MSINSKEEFDLNDLDFESKESFLESGQYDLSTVKKGINSIYGVAASSCDKRRNSKCLKTHISN